jgi:hypothetical protein
VAHAAKEFDGKEEDDVDRSAAFPHAVAPVGAPSLHCFGGECILYCYGAAEEFKGDGGEEDEDGDAAAALPRVVAPIGAPSVYSCGGAEERKGRDGDAAATYSYAVAPVGAPSAAAAGLYG